MYLRASLTFFATMVFALSTSFCAYADLVYEQDVEVSKLELVRVDPEKAKGNRDDIGVEKSQDTQVYSQRVLIKGELMKIRSKNGITIIYDRSKRTVSRIDRGSGTYNTVSLEQYQKNRAETMVKVQKKKKANAEFLLEDLKRMIKNIENKSERERLQQNPPPMVYKLKKIIEGKYKYELVEPRSSRKGKKGVFKALQYFQITENGDEFIQMLLTSELPESPARFYSDLRIVPENAARLLEKRKEFIGEIRFPYDFPDETVRIHMTVKGYCPAELPNDLFEIPEGYVQKETRFETIFEQPEF